MGAESERRASVFGTVASSSRGKNTCYNDELPLPGVIIKQDDIFVEGIAFDKIKKFSVVLRVAKAGYASILFYREKTDTLIGGFILKRDDDEKKASATCSLAKSPRESYAFCLRCDFPGMHTLDFRPLVAFKLIRSRAEDPQIFQKDWEMNSNRKIILCFSETETRTHWLDVRAVLSSHRFSCNFFHFYFAGFHLRALRSPHYGVARTEIETKCGCWFIGFRATTATCSSCSL
jgi:hypothetical protein